MKRIIFLVVMVCALVLPVFAQEGETPAAPKTEEAAQPATTVLEGKIIMKDKDAYLKTATEEILLLPCEKLDELLKIEGYAEKTFKLEGEKTKDKEGKSEGFMIKAFEEVKASESAVEPVNEGQAAPSEKTE